MRSWLFAVALLGLSGMVVAQQPANPTPPATPSPGKTDSRSAAERNPFPEDSPANSQPEKTSSSNGSTPSLAPPRSDRVRADDLGNDVGQSSSKDTQVDLTPPEDDAQKHPQSSNAVAEAEAGITGGSGITEFHAWDPHKAAKSIEVGDFYYKRKNYKAAEERYREALSYKADDAVATLRLAVCLEKLGVFDDARKEYESYLKILPHGPESGQAQRAIDRLKAQSQNTKAQ